ncbi:MAG: hypothetical protein JKY94_17375 [Rhodobacteraceae bacterium]|nr:hypothetical protein [Paracoccaceae bacterium]
MESHDKKPKWKAAIEELKAAKRKITFATGTLEFEVTDAGDIQVTGGGRVFTVSRPSIRDLVSWLKELEI